MERRPFSHPLNDSEKQVYQTVGMRVRTAKDVMQVDSRYTRLATMSREQWLQMGEPTYQLYEQLIKQMYEETVGVRADEQNKNGLITSMRVDYGGIVKHIRVMQNLVQELWPQGLNRLFPADTSIWYGLSLCPTHDFMRFGNINGSLPLGYADKVSDAVQATLFPNSPAPEHLHNMGMITGTSALPLNSVPYIWKLFDTSGKPTRRNPYEFFTSGGEYEKWIAIQTAKKSLPFTTVAPVDQPVPRPSNFPDAETYAIARASYQRRKYIEVSTEKYKAADIALTMQGLKLLQAALPGIDYNAVLDRAAAKVANDPSIVESFGK